MLKEVTLPKIDKYCDLDEIYDNFINQLSDIINKVAPFREMTVTNNSPELFNGEILKGMMKSNKLLRKFKFSKLNKDALQYRYVGIISESNIGTL